MIKMEFPKNNEYKKLTSDAPGTDIFDKNGDKLDGKYINIISGFPTEQLYDKNGNKVDDGILEK